MATSPTSIKKRVSHLVEVDSDDIVTGAITPVKMKAKGEVALTDGDKTLTVSQLIDYGILKQTPSTADTTFTTPTAASIIAALPGYEVGTWFDFTIINLAATTRKITLSKGTDTNITLVGNMEVGAASSGTFRVVITSNSTISIYRI